MIKLYNIKYSRKLYIKAKKEACYKNPIEKIDKQKKVNKYIDILQSINIK